MSIDNNKFNMDFPSDLAPFGYIEDRRVISGSKMKDVMLVSFGAMNRFGHYAPEFGGVAIVHVNPDFLIAVKYIPWDAEARRQELMERLTYLKKNIDRMSAAEVTDYFSKDCDYILPAQKQRFKEEYFIVLAEKNKARAEELKKANERNKEIYMKSFEGSRIIKTAKGFKRRTAKEILKENPNFTSEERLKSKRGKEYETAYNAPQLHVVKNEPQEKKPKMFDGEELIPLDEE